MSVTQYLSPLIRKKTNQHLSLKKKNLLFFKKWPTNQQLSFQPSHQSAVPLILSRSPRRRRFPETAPDGRTRAEAEAEADVGGASTSDATTTWFRCPRTTPRRAGETTRTGGGTEGGAGTGSSLRSGWRKRRYWPTFCDFVYRGFWISMTVIKTEE